MRYILVTVHYIVNFSLLRIVQLARDYSLRRSAFGQRVDSHVLHQLTASRMDVITRGCEVFTLHLARLVLLLAMNSGF